MHKRMALAVAVIVIGILSHFVHAQNNSPQNILEAIAQNNAALQKTYEKNKADNLARTQQQIEQLNPPGQPASAAKAPPSYTFTPSSPPSTSAFPPASQTLSPPSYPPKATPEPAPLPAENPMPPQPNIFVAPTRPGPQPPQPQTPPGVIYR